MRRLRTITLLIGFVLILVACGGSPRGGETSTTTTLATTTTTLATTTTTASTTTTTAPEADVGFPVTVTVANGAVTVEARPTRIVSLSPTATEMLFAVGAGEQVVAADEYSTYPEEAPDTDLSGFTPNIEAILSYDPDLVIVSNDIEDVVASLTQLGIPVALLPAAETLDDTYQQIETVGRLTGHAAEAATLVEEMKASITAAVASVPELGETLTYYHELDPTYFSVTSQTFIGTVYGLFGLENIADPADTDGFGYPQLSPEYIIQADPDLIFLADVECCGVSPEQVAERPGWDQITAVRQGRIYPLDADVASRWGPRIVQFVETVGSVLTEVAGS